VANVNNPYGLKPLMRTLEGGPPQTELWTKQSSYAYAIYKWDPVTQVAGYLKGPANGITAGTTRLLGVALNYAVLSVASNHLVMTSAHAVYDAQGDGSDASLMAAAYYGYNANLNYSGTAGGGTTRDNSGVQITESTVATTSTLDVRMFNLVNDPTNATGAYARMELYINKHLRNPEVTAT
jgi:hypothetical protein